MHASFRLRVALSIIHALMTIVTYLIYDRLNDILLYISVIFCETLLIMHYDIILYYLLYCHSS